MCIPRSAIQQLQKECEHFLSIYHLEKEHDEDQTVRASNQDIEGTPQGEKVEQEADPEVDYYSKKRFSKGVGGKLVLLLKVLIVMVLFDSYFIFAYSFVNYIEQVMERRFLEISSGSDVGSAAMALFAVTREQLMRSALTINNNNNLTAAVDNYLDQYLQITEQLITVKIYIYHNLLV